MKQCKVTYATTMDSLQKNKRSIIILIVSAVLVTVVLIGGGVWLVMYPPQSQSKPYENIIKVVEPKDGLRVETNGDTSSIYYRIPNIDGTYTEEFFNINAAHVLEDEQLDLESPFFSCQKRGENKIMYIILDISGSVVDGIGDDYFDQVISKIYTILSTDVMKPGDQIRIRFLGTNYDSVRNIDFTGPRFRYDATKRNPVQKKNTLNLTGYSYEPLTKCQGVENLMSLKDLTEKINVEYTNRKTSPDKESNISGLLQNISSEVVLEKDRFQSIRYIVFTDGDSTDGYSGCDTSTTSECKEYLKDLNLNNNPSNKAYVIWVKDSDTQELFRRLFDTISINFQ